MRQSTPSDREVADSPALGEDVVNVVHQVSDNEAVSGGDFLRSIEETSEAARAAHQERSARYGSQLQEFAPVHDCPPSSDPRLSFLASKTVNTVTPKGLARISVLDLSLVRIVCFSCARHNENYRLSRPQLDRGFRRHVFVI